jgi:hypothetical protein
MTVLHTLSWGPTQFRLCPKGLAAVDIWKRGLPITEPPAEGAQWMHLEIIQSTTRVLFLKMHGGSEEAQSGSALETHAHHPQHTYARPYPEAEFARARPQTRRCRLGHGISQVSARKVTARVARVVRECVKVRGRQSRNHGDYCREE